MATKELIERRKQGGLKVRRAERGEHWIIAWKGVQWIEHWSSPRKMDTKL